MSPKTTRGSSKASRSRNKADSGFTADERAAMKERARELKADQADGESTLLAKIAEMKGQDRVMAERLHTIIMTAAPSLSPRTWYGMPAYARDGKVLCFFQSAQKFKARYATLGFSDNARLDDGHMWPTSFALKQLTAREEERISELVKRAMA